MGCRCFPTSRAELFGVSMNGGVAAKIKNEERFTNWAWLPSLSPRFASTVFAQPGLHISVWLMIGICNLFYFLVRQATGNSAENLMLSVLDVEWSTREVNVISDSISFLQRLLTWLLTGYVTAIVTMYYRGAKTKGGTMFAGMSQFVNNITVVVNHDCAGADQFMTDLWGAVNGMGHYALARAASNTKFKLSKEEMEHIFDERGLDGKYLLSLDSKDTAATVYGAIIRTLEEEFEKDGRGCLKKTFDSDRFVKATTDLGGLLQGTLQVISSMSSNKLPFAYHHLIHWGVRNIMFITTLFRYLNLASEHISLDFPFPFSCVATDLHDTLAKCPTEEFVWFNAIRILSAYFVFGCLELYPCLAKTWEHSLVLKNYRMVVDTICYPLKPDSERPSLSQMRKKKGRHDIEYAMDKSTNSTDSSEIFISTVRERRCSKKDIGFT